MNPGSETYIRHRLLCRTFAAAVVAALTLLCSQATDAQTYPNRPVRLIVPFPPGGSVDIIARIVATPLSKMLGQPVLVDNRPGAGGTIGAGIAAKSEPDGYTLLLCQSASHALSPALYKALPYDHLKDFVPLSVIGTTLAVLVVHPSMPARSVREYIAYAKANPGKLTYGSAGIGTPGHLAGALFESVTGVELLHVPYKGGAPAQVDLMGGHIMSMFGSLAEQVPVIKAGKVRALGVSSSKRIAQLPEVPTFSEVGVAGFEFSFFYGVCGPAAVPAPIIGTLNTALVRILQLPEVREQMAQRGFDPRSTTSEEFRTLIKDETLRWARVVKEAGITPE